MPELNEKIEKVNKYPLAYALMIVGGLLGIFATNFFNKDKEVIAAYKAQHTADQNKLNESAKNCETNTNFWRDKFLVVYTDLRKQDSIARATLQKPNQELTKAIQIKKRNE